MGRIQSNKSYEEYSLGPLIALIEMEFPNENVNDIDNLRRLLKQEFGIEFSELEILNHYTISLEEEDLRLQYKHLNMIHVGE